MQAMSSYQGVDFYRVDETLSDEERGVRDVVRRFVDERFLPNLRGHFRAGTFRSTWRRKWALSACSVRR
jgi:hypothetical protein